MKGRMFIAVLLLGAMMTCTLVTASAADYRKEKVELTFREKEVMVVAPATFVDLKIYNIGHVDFIVPSNEFKSLLHVTYLGFKNHRKPDNRFINGVLNDRQEHERISIQLRS